MDWKTILKAQQTDFIARLESGDLLYCDKKGKHSELTVISGERLKQLQGFCWEMITKFRPNDPKKYFIKNMKGKLGEEVVKTRLGEFVTEVDYEKCQGGDRKVDFTLTSDSSVGIQVKVRHGNFDQIQWFVSREEIAKNAVLVCILIQEEVIKPEAQCNLILAGFLPTDMIPVTGDKASVRIDELLYAGGLHGYLDDLISSKVDKYIDLAKECCNKKDYESAIAYCNQALELKPNNFDVYNERGACRYALGDKQGAIDDYTQAIKINPYSAKAYYSRGLAHSDLRDKQNAIDDYTQAIKINPNYTDAYYSRGFAHSELGDNQGAIKDLQIAANLEKESGNEKSYQDAIKKSDDNYLIE
ncbi:tetratricopeptide repeat protein [Nodularia harveyana UHCC-0300]|uniref:Tetratricopeptide repeat protein n=1 Tax=Nodularia harveyana UHCC-0300 TaxID=2974287 RepID=A0ABU5UI71_9CYAN|nr:tetratricopeptide repeat protein [Nodularia harveyana]MEA5583202.1 tetratricopeptide repeat protein [Nodularia harveyana UHCC-0300]